MGEKTCFIVSSIGNDGSETRKLADEKYDLIFSQVLEKLNYVVTRADKIGTPGSISYDIVKNVISSDLVIADVSDENPNVFYELAIRNAVKKPVIIVKAPSQKLPFDIYDKRAISIDMKEARLWTKAKEHLLQQVNEMEKDKEQASRSILSEFSFQIDAEKKFSPDKEMALQLRDMKMEIRRLNKKVSTLRNTGIFDSDNFDEFEHVTDEELFRARQDVAKVQLFMDVMKVLEGDQRNPIQEKILAQELVKTGKFSAEDVTIFLRRLLREASIYESKPGYYNRV